jgi:hypothetical protein
MNYTKLLAILFLAGSVFGSYLYISSLHSRIETLEKDKTSLISQKEELAGDRKLLLGRLDIQNQAVKDMSKRAQEASEKAQATLVAAKARTKPIEASRGLLEALPPAYPEDKCKSALDLMNRRENVQIGVSGNSVSYDSVFITP